MADDNLQGMSPDEYLAGVQRQLRGQSPADPSLAMLAGVRNSEQLARMVESQADGYHATILRDCLMCEGWSSDPKNPKADCPHCHGRGHLPLREFEPPRMFTAREMLDPADGQYRWGVRHDSGYWWPERYQTEVQASHWRDWLTLEWLEGREQVLVERFSGFKDGST